MAQVAVVIKGDPVTVAAAIDTLCSTNTVVEVTKTFSAGSFLVVSDNAAADGQTCVVVKGDPATVAAEVQALISGSTTAILTETFSKGSYILVYN